MSGDHDRCFSILVLGAFWTSVFNTNAIHCGVEVTELNTNKQYSLSALPRINIGADVWGGVGAERGLRGEEEGGGVRSGPGAAEEWARSG
jgi:hypothetical protein